MNIETVKGYPPVITMIYIAQYILHKEQKCYIIKTGQNTQGRFDVF